MPGPEVDVVGLLIVFVQVGMKMESVLSRSMRPEWFAFIAPSSYLAWWMGGEHNM
jgi:hypothetical protein